ncbi:hypothetical protein ABKV19_026344, partial [Rosa sericea]
IGSLLLKFESGLVLGSSWFGATSFFSQALRCTTSLWEWLACGIISSYNQPLQVLM